MTNKILIGMTSEILDSVLHEAFRLNKNLFHSCKLTYASSQLHLTTVEAIAEKFSNVDEHEIMIIKTPQKPLSIIDIKTVFVTMLHECKCCFIHDPDTMIRTYDSEDYDDIGIKLCSLSLPSSPRAFSLLHNAVDVSNGLLSICPSYCDRCGEMKCDACCTCRDCVKCFEYICSECDSIDNCSYCKLFSCIECGSRQCSECNKITCETCLNQNDTTFLFCEICGKYMCSECSNPSSHCESGFRHDPHWCCDDCKVVCVGCNRPVCPLDWEGCGFVTCGICGEKKCWGHCFQYIVCEKCEKPICQNCSYKVKFCFKCIKFYCHPKCQSFKMCWSCKGCESTFCGKCCSENNNDECFKCHQNSLFDI